MLLLNFVCTIVFSNFLKKLKGINDTIKNFICPHFNYLILIKLKHEWIYVSDEKLKTSKRVRVQSRSIICSEHVRAPIVALIMLPRMR